MKVSKNLANSNFGIKTFIKATKKIGIKIGGKKKSFFVIKNFDEFSFQKFWVA